jgi:hypothetical protein
MRANKPCASSYGKLPFSNGVISALDMSKELLRSRDDDGLGGFTPAVHHNFAVRAYCTGHHAGGIERRGGSRRRREIFAGKYQKLDSEDPGIVSHYDSYDATGYKISFPGEKAVRWPSDFSNSAPAKVDTEDDD